MADARALLAAERKARRISHPFLQYTKTGQPLCKVCQLNIKSESLWDGHLKSVNHKKNVKAAEAASSRSLKRKLEDVEEEEEDRPQVETDIRKKPKSRVTSLAEDAATVDGQSHASLDMAQTASEKEPRPVEESLQDNVPAPDSLRQAQSESLQPPGAAAAVDEDEWAAFEREMGSLAQVDDVEATISAAPVSAEQLAKQRNEDKQKRQEDDADAEKEEEKRRADEEVEIMEDLGDRVRKLREKREALRTAPSTMVAVDVIEEKVEEVSNKDEDDHDDDDDEDDVDDWYS